MSAIDLRLAEQFDWGECFIKVCSYAPWGLKLYLNGHEWLKRQSAKEGMGFESLDNGFCSCQNPQRLQALAEALGPEQIEAFLKKWLDRLPMPLSAQDRRAGYDYRLSIWQMEFSLTQIVDRPMAGRQFFEEVIRDNLDLGRPDRNSTDLSTQDHSHGSGEFPHPGVARRGPSESARQLQAF
jgi:hypothetical protein